MKPVLTSFVPGHEGACKPVWINRNCLAHRLGGDGDGVTGFFRRVRVSRLLPFVMISFGPEFHGVIRRGGIVQSLNQGAKT